ncbi:cytochrome P450 4C1-like [Planococcus citri]|uniref:cytochrome P450 4C1-like n=1 Tax=Planococcus citri TaxID=170843 RepID=UPI0031F7AC01
MIILTIILFIIAFLIYEKYSKIKKTSLPGPTVVPLIGNALEFSTNEDALFTLFRMVRKYGDIFRVWLCNDLYIIITNPKDIEVLLNSYKHTMKALSYKFVSSWLGNGLITSHGETWRTHRKLLTPTFHFKILENSVEIMHRNVGILKTFLDEKTDMQEFDIHAFIEKCSLDIIGETAMGIKLNVQGSNKGKSYLNAVKSVTNISVSRIFKVWLQPELFFKISGHQQEFQKSLNIMEEVTVNVITSRRKELIEKSDAEITEIKNKPFLDFLLTESNFTDEEIHAEVKSFMFAGHDTTTSAICFCIRQLAIHADVQNKVYEEITKILPEEDDHRSIQTLNKLKYLENVIKETLRLYPSVPMIGRTILEDVILPSGQKIPAHSHVNIFIYSIQRNPEIFRDPDEFIPERFDDDDFKKYPYAFIPFSAGPRNCIGQRLALMEIKMVLATLVRNYHIIATENLHSITLTSELILRSKQGIPIKLKKRV